MPFYYNPWRCCNNLVIKVLLLWLGLGSSLGGKRERLSYVLGTLKIQVESLALAGPMLSFFCRPHFGHFGFCSCG
jgi:hypothetical protein